MTATVQAATVPLAIDHRIARLIEMIGRGLISRDSDGHHARPDIFELRIDRRAREGFAVAEDGLKPA